MPAKQVTINGTSSQDYNTPLTEQAKEREPLDVGEMMYSEFEREIAELSERGIELPPPTDMNGRIMAGYQQEPMTRVASKGNNGMRRQSEAMPASHSEQAIATLMETRDDLINDYIDVSRDPLKASTQVMRIMKVEANIISMGGDLERFDPANYQSGLKPAQESINPEEMAKQVALNTQETYMLKPILSIYTGKGKTGRMGIGIKIASDSNKIIIGSVVPNDTFSGREVIDYIPDQGKGRMTVKIPENGRWKDVSQKFDIRWTIDPVSAKQQ
jgi:hypothetical protein